VSAPPLRYHGSKWRLFKWLEQFIPAHRIYVEPFGGAAAVLIQKARSESEVYNDLDRSIVNYFAVLRDRELRAQLIEQLQLTPYSRQEFEKAYEPCDFDQVESARRVAIRAMMGFGSGGVSKQSTGFRSDSSRKYGTAASIWSEFPDRLSTAGERFSGVVIECAPAIDVIRIHDHPDAFIYVDPPYLHNTREMRGLVYRHEMTADDHTELCEYLARAKGMVMLSGYDDGTYDDALPGWTKHNCRSRISAGRGTKVKTETIWLNPACAGQSKQYDLLEKIS